VEKKPAVAEAEFEAMLEQEGDVSVTHVPFVCEARRARSLVLLQLGLCGANGLGHTRTPVCTAPPAQLQVSSISGSDTDSALSSDDEAGGEADGPYSAAAAAAAAAAGGGGDGGASSSTGNRKHAAAGGLGPQVVFRTQGVPRGLVTGGDRVLLGATNACSLHTVPELTLCARANACWCLSAGGEGFAVWRCLLLADGHKHKQPEPSQGQLLQQLQQLRASAQPPAGAGGAAAAAAADDDDDGGGGGGAAAAAAEAAAAGGGCVWALFMLRGGHFAAAIVRLNSGSGSGSGSGSRGRPPEAGGGAHGSGGDEQRAASGSSSSSSRWAQGGGRRQQQASAGQEGEPFTVLAHKTFHRYVVRCVVLHQPSAAFTQNAHQCA
jgi:hypothetical protein